ncbi:VOC family protein [Paenibacillus sp. GCM10027628]|uniref:VOC family protein n=1 Tax=Paenibacillus sp. GCM10027628 TaxID=3273413 RepID=UPI00363EB453
MLVLGHVGLNVTELDRSIQFYKEVLGFTLRMKSEEPGRKFAFLGDDQVNRVTLWEQSEGSFSKQTPGLHHLAFEVESVEIIQAYEARLKEHGVKFIYNGITAHAEGGDSGGIFFEDPDGIRLEIYVRQGIGGHTNNVAHGRACGFF